MNWWALAGLAASFAIAFGLVWVIVHSSSSD